MRPPDSAPPAPESRGSERRTGTGGGEVEREKERGGGSWGVCSPPSCTPLLLHNHHRRHHHPLSDQPDTHSHINTLNPRGSIVKQQGVNNRSEDGRQREKLCSKTLPSSVSQTERGEPDLATASLS